MQSNNYIFAPTRTLNGGVGSYTNQFIATFRQFRIVTGCEAKQLNGASIIKLKGFNSRPSFKTILDLYKHFGNVKNGVFIYQGSLALLIIFVMRFLCRDSVHIVIFHGLASRYTNKLVFMIEWLAAQVASHCIFLTDHDRVRLSKTSRCTKIPNYCVETPTCTSSYESSVAVTVTRLSKQKNLAYNLHEFKDLPLSLHVYGVGADACNLHGRLNGSMQNNIHFKGIDIPKNIYTNKFVFILSTYSEGFPLSILEAASHEIPLLVSDIPELKEVLGDNAWYFKNDEPGDLSDKLLILKNNKNKYDQLRQKSKCVSQNYSIENWREAWCGVFKDLKLRVDLEN